ncbi:MAG: hypothetical protein KAZ28_06135 [Bacteroidaceae bacterium]|jgi:uncharacterized protein (DUF2164 family)|nr:hypothetical protein [Bacteroidaceae bacterium]
MSDLEEELMQDAEEDARIVEYIKNYLPSELKETFSDNELYYFLDVIVDYYANSGVLDAEPDKDGFVDIDLDKVVDYVVEQAKKDKVGDFKAEDVLFVVQGEMEYEDEQMS